MAQLFAVIYGKFAINLPVIDCFGTFETDLSDEKDFYSDTFLEDLHLGSILSIESLRYLLEGTSSLSESMRATDCLLKGLGRTRKRALSWLRACYRGESILLALLLGMGGSFLAKFIASIYNVFE